MNDSEEYEVEVFYDGGCPLCRREINVLRRRDRQRRVRFTDINAPNFSPEPLGRTHAELMARLHGRLPDGTWIDGVEVFRRLYAAAGFRRLVSLSRWPVISPALDLAYRVFARHRLRLTGRCSAGACKTRSRPVAELQHKTPTDHANGRQSGLPRKQLQ